jgi:hypothetical protein
MLLPRGLLLYIVQNKFILVFIATLYLYRPYNLIFHVLVYIALRLVSLV